MGRRGDATPRAYRQFTEHYKFNDYPETGALLFIWGALTYPDAFFKKPSA
jgi:hypothetical protein